MLNNDFNVLVKKYKQYKQQKKKSRNRRILLLIIIGALAYYISTLNFSKPIRIEDKNETLKAIKENNKSIAPIVKKNEINNTKETKAEQNFTKKIPPKRKVKKVSTPKRSGLKVTTNEKSLYQLLENQAQSQSYSATIAIANYHYSKKAYQKAIKWAIEASKKNKSKVRPWIVYAKSKKALGKDEIAKKALTLFLKRHQSQEAQELLNSL